MASPYRDKLDKIRLTYPPPVSDRVHDSYFVQANVEAVVEKVLETRTQATL
jgi:hypothetical protein